MSYGRTEIPVVVINHVKILDGFEITEERLDKEIRLAESGPYKDYGPGTGTSSESGILAILFSYFLGIMTGLSPCLLGTLVVMIAATAGIQISEDQTPLCAIFWCGLVTTYLIIAAGVLIAGFRLTTGSGFSTTIYLVIGIATISFGIIQLGLIRFPEMVQVRTTHLLSRFKDLKGAFLLGIILAIILAPCAGAPFLILMETLLFAGSTYALVRVLLFGAGILTPFFIIGMVSGSIPEERLVRYSFPCPESERGPAHRIRDLAAPGNMVGIRC